VSRCLPQTDVRFFFYSNEGSPREKVHIHVEKGDADSLTNDSRAITEKTTPTRADRCPPVLGSTLIARTASIAMLKSNPASSILEGRFAMSAVSLMM
jgi:hypothetical protein